MRTRDKFRGASDGLRMDLSHKSSDTGYKIKGELRWVLEDTTTGEITEGKMTNIVTLDASILIARLMKSTAVPHVSEPSFGAYALAVGTGLGAWDPMSPPIATATQRSLYNEIARKQFSITNFINGGGNISTIPTPVIDLTTTFSEAEAVGAIDEMMILGGDISTNMAIQNPILPPNGPYNASFDVVSFDMGLNYITMPVVNKPATSTWTIVWRLTF